MNDPFEQTLRDLFNESTPESPQGRDRLDRVLKTANRQVGAFAVFGLIGSWGKALCRAGQGAQGNIRPIKCSAGKISK